MFAAFHVATRKPDKVISGARDCCVGHYGRCSLLCLDAQHTSGETTRKLRFAVASNLTLSEVLNILRGWLKNSDLAAKIHVDYDSADGSDLQGIERLIACAKEPIANNEIIYLTIHCSRPEDVLRYALKSCEAHYRNFPLAFLGRSEKTGALHFATANPTWRAHSAMASILSVWLRNGDSEARIELGAESVVGADLLAVERLLRSTYDPPFQSRNAVEKVHLDSIIATEGDNHPLDFLLDNQIDWRRYIDPKFAAMMDEKRDRFGQWLERVRKYSPSRFELLDQLVIYISVHDCVSSAIEMTHDTYRFHNYGYNFRVVTDPRHDVNAYVIHSSYPEPADIVLHDGQQCHLVWFNVGLYHLLLYSIRRFLLALMQNGEDLEGTLHRLAEYDLDALERLVQFMADASLDFAAEFTQSLDMGIVKFDFQGLGAKLPNIDNNTPLRAAVNGLQNALTTFIVGHECAHILLGHTGHFPRRNIFNGPQRPVTDPQLLEEMAADFIGFNLMQDGCSKIAKTSVDYSCIAPWVFLTHFITVSQIKGERAFENDWVERLKFSIMTTIDSLRHLGFEVWRQERVARLARASVWVLNQWMLEVSHRQRGSPRKNGEELFHSLSAIAKL